MPFIEVAIVGSLPQPVKHEMARLLTDVFTTPGSPAEWVTLVFRHIDTSDYAIGGRFLHFKETFDSQGCEGEQQSRALGPVMLNVTNGQLDEPEKRRIAVGISDALTMLGVPESYIKIFFRHSSGRDIAEGGGVFTFRPPGSLGYPIQRLAVNA